MGRADAEHGDGVVTLAQAGRGKGDRVALRVNGRTVATLTAASVVALGVRDGDRWTAALSGAVERRGEFERAHRAAQALISRKGMSRAALTERLARRGFGEGAIGEVIAGLGRAGMLDDAALARDMVRSALERGGAAAPLLEAKLTARGVDAGVVREAVQEGLEGRDVGADAEALAKRRWATMSPALAVEARVRRVYAYLARRGYDEETCERAVRAASGGGE